MKAGEETPEFEEPMMHGLEFSELGKFDNVFFDSDFFEDNSELRNADCSHLEEREERLYNTPAGPRTEQALEPPLEIGAVVRKNRSAYNLFIKEKVLDCDQFSKEHFPKIQDLQAKQAMDLLSQEWRALPPAEKLRFEAMARRGTCSSPEKADYDKFKKSKFGKKLRKTEKQLPKNPASAFLKFQAVERSLNEQLYRHMPVAQASKAIAAKWKQLKPEFRAALISEYKSEIRELAKAKQALKVIELKGKKANPPKKQVHQPFVAFIKSEYAALKRASPQQPHAQIIRSLGERWHRLTEAEKQVYKQQLLTN